MRSPPAALVRQDPRMLYAGEGPEVWHVRVDLIAPDCDGARVTPTADALGGLLHGSHEGHGHGYGVDQGIGIEGQPVLGLTFWVRAKDVGAAATAALDTARGAGAVTGAGPDYYDVSLVPRSAIVGPKDEHEMRMAD